MWLNNYNDSAEDIDLSSSVSEGVSEQYQEKAKRAQAQLKKIQKDEKSARGDNQKLFLILTRFIQDPYYASLINDVTALLSATIPSRGVISMIALFYPDATFYVLENLGKKEKLNLLLSLPKNEELQDFDEKTTHSDIKKWMSEWILFTESFLIEPSWSILMTKKFLKMISGEHAALFEKVLTDFIVFFFKTRNINMSSDTAMSYSRFIRKNIVENLSKYLQSQSQNAQELIADAEVTTDSLFGS